jgi:peptidyl-prolyl cis-trans isomerase C
MNTSLLRASVSVLALAAVIGINPLMGEAHAQAGANVATVNGKAIPKSRADALVAAQVAQGQPDSPELRDMVRKELIRREILAQESAKQGYEKNANVLPQLMLARQSVLINAYVGDYVRKHPVSDDLLKKEYDTIKLQLGDKEYKVRHILVEKEDEAKDIIAKLDKGEKFEELAKASKDPGSRERGGELGWAAPSNYVKPFSAAMTQLEKGKYTSAPVKSDFGYHVILLDDTRELKLPSFEEARPQLAQRMQQQIVEKHIADLLSKAKVQ